MTIRFFSDRFSPGYFTHNGQTVLNVSKKMKYIPGGKEHWHDYYEIEYYYRAEGIVVMNGREMPLCGGNISFLTPSDFHYIKTDKDVDVLNISFTADFLDSKYISYFLNNKNKNYCIGNTQETEMILNKIYQEYNKHAAYSEDIIKGLIMVLIADSLKEDAPRGKDENYTFVHSATEYVLSHYTEDITLSSVAKLCGLSESHFSKLFKKTVGQTFKEYITDLRLGMIKSLLENSTLSVTEITYSVGYSSLSHMSKLFKSVFGMSPKEYRKKYREE